MPTNRYLGPFNECADYPDEFNVISIEGRIAMGEMIRLKSALDPKGYLN